MEKMEKIKIKEEPKGTYSCNIGISTSEWETILNNTDVTTGNYTDALMAFYKAPGHKSTCKTLSQKYYGNAKDAQKYNSWLTSFGRAVVKYLNRFHVIDADGKERFWPISMSSGRQTEDGLFETTLRPELVQAIENLGWNKNMTWIPFYMEMADKLLPFKSNRKPLLDIVYALDKDQVGYIKTKEGGHIEDIDPFSVYGIFNRGISNDNRRKVCQYFKDKFGISANIPADFDGVPVLNNMKAVFFWSENILTDVQPLWELFESVLNKNSKKIRSCFDIVSKQQGIKWNITMGLYWIRPFEYLSLDSRNRDYLSDLGLPVFKETQIDASHYEPLLNTIKDKMRSGEVKEDDFPEISYSAWKRETTNESNIVSGPATAFGNDNHLPQMRYAKYIELLKECHNLVLTGAPGTGKTYMAQAIAKEMGCTKDEMCFVQFHPSYDYTDFVEGLRPVEKEDGQIGFERRDGVFKEFCKAAAKNLVDSQKSVENLAKELSWEEKLQQFVENAVDNSTKYHLTNGSEFTVIGMKGRTIIVHNEQNEKTTQVAVNADDIIDLLTNEVPLHIVRDIRTYFQRRFGTQPDSYAFIIVKEVKKMKTTAVVPSASKIERKDFVFIIDEINRGEASKIFGELFYAIDPGYRGKTDIRVKTQYQNLIPEGDLFADGFYVPENVYILATMNDIDRSVESMDFAMRRRFTWQEVTPSDTESMLDSLACAEKAKAAMRRLNDVIADTEGLGAAYAIGPSYFLKLAENGNDFGKLWTMNIRPLLKEYLRGFRKAEEKLSKCEIAYFGQEQSTEMTSSDNLEP